MVSIGGGAMSERTTAGGAAAEVATVAVAEAGDGADFTVSLATVAVPIAVEGRSRLRVVVMEVLVQLLPLVLPTVAGLGLLSLLVPGHRRVLPPAPLPLGVGV